MYQMSPDVKLKILIVTIAALITVNATNLFSAEKGQMELIAVITGNGMMGKFNQPSSLFFDESKKRLYISDAETDRLISFDNEFLYLAEFAEEALKFPMGIVRNKQGQFFVVSRSDGDIIFIDIKEKVIKPLVISGMLTKGKGFIPGRIAIDRNDRLYVTDRLNERIIVLDLTGAFIKEITVEDDEIYGFSDVRVDVEGNIYAVDTIAGAVYVFNKEGEKVLKFGSREILAFPTSLAVDSKGLIYVVDQHRGKVKVFSMKGVFLYELFRNGWRERELRFPSYIFIDREDRLYIADRGNNRIQIFKEERK